MDTQEKKARYYQLFEEMCDQIFIDGVIPLWSDWDELNQNFEVRKAGMHGQELRAVQVCPYPFYSLIINADGEVTVLLRGLAAKARGGRPEEPELVGHLARRAPEDLLEGHAVRQKGIV